MKVLIGDQTCNVVAVTDLEVTCNLNPKNAGTYSVLLQLNNQGNSNNDLTFTYDLSISNLSNSEGKYDLANYKAIKIDLIIFIYHILGSIGGSLSLVIAGQGFSANTTVTICGNVCKLLNSTVTSIVCQVPAASIQTVNTTCPVVVTENSLKETRSFAYKLSLTPKLTSVSPLRGGTGGGTLLTISGTNFPYIKIYNST